MDKVEIMTSRQYITVKDLEKIFACGRSTAERVMRQIKVHSDIARIKGKVTTTDYEAWFNGPIANAAQ